MQIDRETLLRTGIPERYWAADTDLELPRDRGLYLWGLVGRGKTHAACALALRELRNGTPVYEAGTHEVVAYRRPMVRFISMIDAKNRVSDTFGTRQNPAELRAMLRNCDLLVLDDVGREDAKPWVQEFLMSVVDDRYNAPRHRTIVTSNYSRGELAGRIMVGSDATMANAIVSRLAEMTTPIHMEGPDRRIQQ